MNEKEVIGRAREVLRLERDSIDEVIASLGNDFLRAIELLLKNSGRVIVTGIGKSGIVAKKIAATLTSTGTPAIFLHPTESLHGDLGIVGKDDVVIAVSKSGETDEFNLLIPLLKRWAIPIIAITANPSSDLAKNSDIVLRIPAGKEACPFDLAPTVSTTATMALGDAIAVVLLYEKKIKLEDFAALHPGGSIGKRLWIKVRDMMLTGDRYLPVVSEDAGMRDVIMEMTTKRGITSVINQNGVVTGVITDGDLRRLLEREKEVFLLKAKDVMTRNPKLIGKDELAAKAAQKMEEYGITALIVVDREKRPIGIIHLHDIMKERVV